jgi:hypothetical protein
MNNFELLDSLYKEEFNKININNYNKIHMIIVFLLILLILYKY